MRRGISIQTPLKFVAPLRPSVPLHTLAALRFILFSEVQLQKKQLIIDAAGTVPPRRHGGSRVLVHAA